MTTHKKRFSNPIIKDQIEILEDSEYKLIFRTYLQSGGGQSTFHYHSKLNEKFTIIEGELSVMLNSNEKVLKTNDEQIIKPFTIHKFYNTSDKEVIFDVEVTNAKQMKNALLIMYGLTADGKTNKDGLPNNIFHTAIGLKMMDAFTPEIPLILQKIGITVLATLGKIIGIEKILLQKYCTDM